ncbi:MAG: hypothetical protein WCL50_11540 [Spirochaetota bacterium]
MSINDYIALSILVLTDFRVIAATLAVILSWILFRFVGIIVKRNRRPPKVLRGAAPPPPEAKDDKASPEIEE